MQEAMGLAQRVGLYAELEALRDRPLIVYVTVPVVAFRA